MREYDVYSYFLSNKNLIRIPTKSEFFNHIGSDIVLVRYFLFVVIFVATLME